MLLLPCDQETIEADSKCALVNKTVCLLLLLLLQHYYLYHYNQPLLGYCTVVTLRPSIWLIAADSLSVHSSITFCLISFMNSMKALSGFLTTGRRGVR